MPFSRSTFAENLRVFRAKRSFSQTELAKRSGLTPDLIWNYENERITPGADKAYSIAEALGCTLNDLCGWGIPASSDPGEVE